MTEAAGRDPQAIGVAYRIKQYAYAAPPASDGNRRLFSGSIADTIVDIKALRDLGVGSVNFSFEGCDADKTMREMRQIRDEVIDKIGVS
jgi:hypothetical protein